MEATLHSIASTDPGARVDVAVMSEGRWGGMVDEIGVPVDWDVEDDICLDLGLDCTQVGGGARLVIMVALLIAVRRLCKFA